MANKASSANNLVLADYTQLKIFGDPTRSFVYIPDFLNYIRHNILDENGICQIVKEEVDEQLKGFDGGSVDLDPDKQKLTTELPQAKDSVETVGEALVYLDDGLYSAKNKADQAYSLASNNDTRVTKLSTELTQVSNIAHNANNTCEILRDDIDMNTQFISDDRIRMGKIEDSVATKLEAKVIGKGVIVIPNDTYVNGNSHKTFEVGIQGATPNHFALVNPLDINGGVDHLQYTANITSNDVVTVYVNNNFDVGVIIASEIRIVVLDI